jgi:hypothetical protein
MLNKISDFTDGIGLGKGTSASMKITGSLLSAYASYGALSTKQYLSKYNQSLIDSEQVLNNAAHQFEIRRTKRIGNKLLSSARAVIGKSGLEYSGSPVDVMEENVQQIELDLFALRHAQNISQFQADTQKRQLEIQEKKAKSMKAPAAINAFIGGFV